VQPNLAEAERRIEEARRTQAESLDLGDLALRELPAGLKGLPHLRTLYLGLAKPDASGAIEWDFDRRIELIDLSLLSKLQGLDSLDLSGSRITDLSLLSDLQGLQSLDLRYCQWVTDLSPLSVVQGLQSLDLGVCKGVTDLSPLSVLQGLQSLDFKSCQGLTDLSPLLVLQGLQSLDLQFCRNVTDLSPLSGLQGLQSLDLGSCEGVTDLSPLSSLQGLQSLDLRYCQWVTDLSPLSGLQDLQSLDLRSCEGVTDLSPLSGLQGLQRLDLGSCRGVTDLSPLSGLQSLRSLDLSKTGVTDLLPLSGLPSLQSLHLYLCGRVTDLSPLSGLQGLQSLDLDLCFRVNDLSPLSGLSGLQTLHLSFTSVSDLSPLSDLRGLQSLDLSNTAMTDLSPLSGLQDLRSLDLYRCRPGPTADLLSAFSNLLDLTGLCADEVVGIPREVLSHKAGENCLPRLRTYFSELALGAEAENEVKVILLGNGRVGKTQLCRRFRGKPFGASVPSTHGVQIWREELRLQTGGQEKDFQINWWDFGGQDIYHGTHALFLQSRAVFLILWTPSLENRDEYPENGIPLRNQPLAYWLDYVRSLAGEGSPVIIVQSQCDRFSDRRPDPSRTDGFEFFECCAYSAKEGLGREILEGQLHNAIRYLLERNGALEIGGGRAEVRRQLYAWRSEDQEREPNERQHRTLTLDEFRALCDGTEGILSWQHALDYFHHTGVLFYRRDLFSNRIILDQDWALDAIYTVFHRSQAAPWLRDSGRFTQRDLAGMVWQTHSPEEQRLFLGLMESCGVCFPCGEASKGETRYIAPDLLPSFEAVADRVHLFWNETPDAPTLRLEYRFFHPAIIRNLMSVIGRRAGNLGEYWRYGLWFKDGQRDSQLLVQFEDTSTYQAPGAGVLVLKALGRDPRGLVREIRKTILEKRIGEKPEELLTLDGTTVSRSALANIMEGRVIDVQKRLAPAAEFIAFFEDRELRPDEARGIGESAAINIEPVALAAGEKPKEVFISYAWGDETDEGKIRSKAVDGLHAALERDGVRTVRDRDQMRAGDRISSFISQLTRSDLVVAVISEKYLRSTYCMFEIYKLWQRSQGEPDLLAKILVPIVLPEVKIGNLRERLPYLEYWASEAESLEALVRNPRISPSRESWEEVRLVREFAHHVDGILVFIQDVLMPRKLEAHLDDGFQAVRDALRLRMGAELI
jgi:internalin A